MYGRANPYARYFVARGARCQAMSLVLLKSLLLHGRRAANDINSRRCAFEE